MLFGLTAYANLPLSANAEDVDGETRALTDGLLIIRRLFGFEGSALTAGALGSNATRTDPGEIKNYIDSLSP